MRFIAIRRVDISSMSGTERPRLQMVFEAQGLFSGESPLSRQAFINRRVSRHPPLQLGLEGNSCLATPNLSMYRSPCAQTAR